MINKKHPHVLDTLTALLVNENKTSNFLTMEAIKSSGCGPKVIEPANVISA